MAKTTTTRKTRTVSKTATPATTTATSAAKPSLTPLNGGKKKAKVATARQIQEALSDIKDEYLMCRDIGHNWRQYAVRKARGGFERSMFCRQCKTARHQFISNRGEILSNQYSYVDGYQFRGLGRIVAEGKGLIRLETIDRVLAGEHDVMLEQPETPIGKRVAPAEPIKIAK